MAADCSLIVVVLFSVELHTVAYICLFVGEFETADFAVILRDNAAIILCVGFCSTSVGLSELER